MSDGHTHRSDGRCRMINCLCEIVFFLKLGPIWRLISDLPYCKNKQTFVTCLIISVLKEEKMCRLLSFQAKKRKK